MIYENDFELWALDVPSGAPQKLAIRMAFDGKENDIDMMSTTNRADGFAPSPTGDYLAVDFRGEVRIVPTEAGVGERTPVTKSPWRERFQVYSPDGRRLAYISDESGDEEIWIYDLANEMIGELNASHTGVNGPPTRAMPRVYSTRFLGVELEPTDAGRYRIGHIYRDGPADKEWLGLSTGDYVLSIDGQEVKSGENCWEILSSTVNEYIPITVAKAASGDGARTVRIDSVTSLTDIKYEEWVANNRDAVEKDTKGDIAYVHIRSMDQPSLARFRNEIDRLSNKKGIIVDIRTDSYALINGGTKKITGNE